MVSTGLSRKKRRRSVRGKRARLRGRKSPLLRRKLRLRGKKRRLVKRWRGRKLRLVRGKRRFRKGRLKARRKRGKRRLRHLRRLRRLATVETPTAPIQPEAAAPAPQPETGFASGINIIGYTRAETGIGESSRLAARAAEAAEIPFGLMHFSAGTIRMDDMSWAHKEISSPQYKVNVIHTNADAMRSVHHHFGAETFDRRCNIGYWHWELPDFPDEFCDGFHFVQEVWAPSQFVVESIARKSPVPVVCIPHGVQVHVPDGLSRGHYGLPDDKFLFFSMYDTHSYQRRKNPQGAILAFKQAFSPDDHSVGLVVKLNHSAANPSDLEALHQLIGEHDNIYVLDRDMDRGEVNGLLDNTDCFVSLHRSEGFGLGLAEAMHLGKPVIGTNWSGNKDFMNEENSCLVDYSIVSVGEDWGPYKGYQQWAEPSIEHAARHMREVRYNTDFRNRIAFNGMQHIHTHYSPKRVGQLIKERLRQLGQL